MRLLVTNVFFVMLSFSGGLFLLFDKARHGRGFGRALPLAMLCARRSHHGIADRELSVNQGDTVNQGAKIPLNDTHELALSMKNHINLTEKR